MSPVYTPLKGREFVRNSIDCAEAKLDTNLPRDSTRMSMPLTLVTRLAAAHAQRMLIAALLALAIASCVPLVATDPAVVAGYDAKRDAAADIDRAISAARASGKRVLIAVGGDWCKDCRELDQLFAAQPALAAQRDERFVWVKVFLGSENRNEAVLARYPKIEWVPTLIVLDRNGQLQASVPSTEFHVGERLSAERVQNFFGSH